MKSSSGGSVSTYGAKSPCSITGMVEKLIIVGMWGYPFIKKHGRMQRFEGKMGSDNSAVNDETKKSSKIMILESKPTMLKIKEIITLSSSDEEDHENSNCKDFFTTKQDANTFQNNILDLVVAVSAHKEKPKDDSDRETVIERISKMTIPPSSVTRGEQHIFTIEVLCPLARRIGWFTKHTTPISKGEAYPVCLWSKAAWKNDELDQLEFKNPIFQLRWSAELLNLNEKKAIGSDVTAVNIENKNGAIQYIELELHIHCSGKQLVDFEIDNSEIVDIKGYLGRTVPIIFFRTKCSSGEKIRRCLNMTEAGPYFDPDSQDQSHKRIVLLPKQLDEASKKTFKKIFTRSFLHITKREANQLLLLSSPKEVLPVSKADKPQEQPKLIISNRQPVLFSQHLISLRQVLSATETTRSANAAPFRLLPHPTNTTNVSFPPPPSSNFGTGDARQQSSVLASALIKDIISVIMADVPQKTQLKSIRATRKRTATFTENGEDRRRDGAGTLPVTHRTISFENGSGGGSGNYRAGSPSVIFSQTWLPSRAGCRNTALLSQWNFVLERGGQCLRCQSLSPTLQRNFDLSTPTSKRGSGN
uniref:Uncharacterized protein n=1 Tax=Timema tahoe TaxID=61484 RepID=A0A7R9IH73_9NEOP|nr:unnamed protein product [Timema tahoe]